MYNQASIYKGGGVYNLGDGASTKLPAKTLRFLFSKPDYDPTVAGVGSGGTWQKVDTAAANVWDWTKNDASWNYALQNAFTSSDNIVDIVAAGDMSGVTSIGYAFSGNTSLRSVCLFDTSNVTNFSYVFQDCVKIETLPDFNTTKCTNMGYAFAHCYALKRAPQLTTSLVSMFTLCFDGCNSIEEVPLYDTSKATNVTRMFRNCTKVEEGALALYTQMSTQTTPPETFSECFLNCGSGTTTGTAELAQIPASWGGTAPASLNMGAPQNLTEPLSPSVIEGDDSLTK